MARVKIQLLTLADLAEMWGYSLRTMRAVIHEPGFPDPVVVRKGKRPTVKWRRREVEAYLDLLPRGEKPPPDKES